MGAAPVQERVNRRVYLSPRLVLTYLWGPTRPAERWFLEHFGPSLAGRRVLEIGCGAGRITRSLLDLTPDVTGVDLSPAMVAFCRRRFGRGTYVAGDMRLVRDLVEGPFDAVVAGANVLDVLSHVDRAAVLADLAALLAPGGVLYFSSHNRRSTRVLAEAAAGPSLRRSANPYRQLRALVNFALGKLNHAKLAPYQELHPGYAVLNDDAHGWRLLHYYVDRDLQADQLRSVGLEPAHVVTPEGAELRASDDERSFTELHYIALRPERDISEERTILST